MLSSQRLGRTVMGGTACAVLAENVWVRVARVGWGKPAKIGNILYNSAICGGRIEICIRPSVPCAPAKPVAGTKLLVRHRAAKKRTESGEKNFAIGLPVCGIYANFVTENPAK